MKKNQKGFSLIELLIVVVVIGIIASIAIPNLLASRRAANETAAVASLRVILTAQATYRSQNSVYGDLTALKIADLLDPNLAGGAKSGYSFTYEAGTNTAIYWGISAVPQVPAGPGSTGYRSFATNESGVVLSLVGGTAPNISPDDTRGANRQSA